MRVELQSTTKIVYFNGVPARLWEGRTAYGVPVIAFITRIATERDQDLAEFERDLQEHAPPSVEAEAFPVRMLID